MHVDPKFSRTPARSDFHVPLRSATDIAFLGGEIHYILEKMKYFHDYVANYTNAALIVGKACGFKDGLFSGYDPEKRCYDRSNWDFEIGPDQVPLKDTTLKHERCVFQLLRNHYARYTVDNVFDIKGASTANMMRVYKAFAAAGTPGKSGTMLYALGWAQHTVGGRTSARRKFCNGCWTTIIDRLLDRLPKAVPVRPGEPAGMWWLTRQPLVPWDSCMTAVISDFTPTLVASCPNLKADFKSIASMVEKFPDAAGSLSRAWLDGCDKPFNSLNERSGISAGELGFAIHWGVSTLLNTLRIGAVVDEDQIPVTAGHCPYCDRLPAMALLSTPEVTINDFLSGDGEQKYLCCGLCGQPWRFARQRCPQCEANHNRHLVYYRETKMTGERIDACRRCCHYFLCLDLRQSNAPPFTETTAGGLIHPDILAREKGFLPDGMDSLEPH